MTSKSGASNLASTSPISRLFSLMPHNVVNAFGIMQRRLLRYPERPDDAYALVIRVADELGVKEKVKGKYYACTADGWSSDPFDDPIEAARAYRQRVVSVELAHLQPQPLAPGLEICTGPRCFHILEVGDHIVECVHFILMDRTNVDTGIACNAAVMSLPNPFLTTP